jgi:hypothetical protein
MEGEVCVVCGAAPVLYFSNGAVFCKAHKADATRTAQVGYACWRRERFSVVDEFHMDHRSSVCSSSSPRKDGKTRRTR